MARPTSSSDLPNPYAGAVSISVRPSSSAARTVLMASASSLPPHIEPPIAQVPSPIRELANPTPEITFCSIGSLPSLSFRRLWAASRFVATRPQISDRAKRVRASVTLNVDGPGIREGRQNGNQAADHARHAVVRRLHGRRAGAQPDQRAGAG